MKRFAVIAALLLATIPGLAFAQASHRNIGLGFHDVSAPVGLRWWFSGQKVAIDVGLGYSTRTAETDPDESLSRFAVDLGVPFVMQSWERVHVILRPGLLYESDEVGTGTGPTFETRSPTTMLLTAELEAEVFLADNVSFSASHGIGWGRVDEDIPGVDETTAFSTLGNNFTQVGFHVYFLGGHE
jgi:hypothetical protein